MRHLLTLFCLTFFLNLTAQFNWTQLPAVDSVEIELLSILSNDDFIGFHPNPRRLLRSTDQGESWNVMYSGTFLEATTFSTKIFEDRLGQIYVSVYDVVYSYSEIDQTLDTAFHLNSPVSDIDFLPNNDMLLGERSVLYLIPSSGQPIDTFTISNQYVLDILCSDSTRHYVICDDPQASAHSLRVFNTQSQWLSGSINTPISTNEFEIIGNRIFTKRHYSDNGTEWLPYNNRAAFFDITRSSNGKFIGLTDENVLVSEDLGDTFESFRLPANLRALLGPFATDEEIWLVERICPDPRHFMMKPDNGQWVDQSERFATDDYFVEGLEAGVDGNVIVSLCQGIDRVLLPNTNNWEALSTFDHFMCSLVRQPVSTPDGTFISYGGCRSTNFGLDWKESDLHFIQEILPVKNGVIYANTPFGDIYKSVDFGASYEPVEAFADPFMRTTLAVTSSEEKIHFNERFTPTAIVAVNTSGDVRELPIEAKHYYDFESDYFGSGIYAVDTISGNGGIEIQRSDDDGRSFNTDTLLNIEGEFVDLLVDHFNNLYLLTEETLLMSTDGAENWTDITPQIPELDYMVDIDVGFDGHIYLATRGTHILKSELSVGIKNQLTVLIFEDVNDNCSYDNEDLPLPGIDVRIGKNTYGSSDQQGFFYFSTFDNQDSVLAVLNSNRYSSCDNAHVFDFSGVNKDTVFIPIRIVEQCTDLFITVSSTNMKPCSTHYYSIRLENRGTETIDSLEFNLEYDMDFEYLSSDFEVIDQGTSNLRLLARDIQPRQSMTGKVYFELDCDVQIYEEHCSNLSARETNSCEGSGDIQVDICHINTLTDGNIAKRLYTNGRLSTSILDDEQSVEYEISFQNTTGQTINDVTIEDQLSSVFDLSSVRPVVASHPYTWRIEQQKLIIEFRDISLIDSTTNPTESQGFVRFQIKTNDQAAPGSMIRNIAQVYFDEEYAGEGFSQLRYLCRNISEVVNITICEGESYEGYTTSGTYRDVFTSSKGCDSTRTLRLEVLPKSNPRCQGVSTSDNSSQPVVNIYPNPFSNAFMLDLGEVAVDKIEIYNQYGQEVYQRNGDFGERVVIQPDIPDGMYYLRLFFKEQSISDHALLKL